MLRFIQEGRGGESWTGDCCTPGGAFFGITLLGSSTGCCRFLDDEEQRFTFFELLESYEGSRFLKDLSVDLLRAPLASTGGEVVNLSGEPAVLLKLAAGVMFSFCCMSTSAFFWKTFVLEITDSGSCGIALKVEGNSDCGVQGI